MAVILLSNDRIEPAIAQFEAAVAADPSMIEALHNLAMAYLLIKNDAAAIKPLRQVLQYTPDSVDALTNLATILCKEDPKLRDLPEAVRLAEHAAKITGRKQVDVLATLARTYTASGRHNDAEAVVNEMAALREKKAAAGARER